MQGSSFVCDPYGRVLAQVGGARCFRGVIKCTLIRLAPHRRPQAPRAHPAVIVAELDLGARRDWLTLFFPVLTTRRPAAYTAVTRTDPPPLLPRWLGGCVGSGPEPSPRPGGGSGSSFSG